jgi:hypothetical protein
MLTKDQIEQIKVGDKFTVEFEAAAIEPNYILSTTGNNLYTKDKYILAIPVFISHEPKPLELVVGMRVPVWIYDNESFSTTHWKSRAILTDTQYSIIIAIHNDKAWLERTNGANQLIDLSEIRKRFELLSK